ncbi:unnamed protein product [Linum tenue]|uniref:Polygalacturonase n=1 Tax=Linum tenue TaxID=586396 RepID=A0AAV0P3M3_9ROSI|nr:unnamed protein product [Linum tenue]
MDLRINFLLVGAVFAALFSVMSCSELSLPTDQTGDGIKLFNVMAFGATGTGTTDDSNVEHHFLNFSVMFSSNDCTRPTALRISNCVNVRLSGLKHFNSQRNHISIDGCNDVIVSGLHIFAPEQSPNTDGIDIAGSTNIQVMNSVIQTGDDCIAINTLCSNVNITGVTCGPGHGIREELDMQDT